ncbi:PLP-dependent transferase [Dothidotthia symphoricarpi CBS 119687]|uniref:PLP-dependent transferase n=1 Tax=Dothidotthia symphoricarpi CBS 119687 TaxID=1392245 RepID=A0A6A6ABP0_9PLEO|nr:PLP-dependent transferase [Dothidotthia symphoricarpi CBS 119687]KAF2128308.1 PLP-dependent transferase [Dothidotthia symphoricarpi CBS 119687]
MAELSSRMQKPVSAILPKIAATISERTSTTPKIDLATAENWLLRPEILDICKEAVQSSLTLAHLSYPAGFGGDPKLQATLATFFNKYFNPVSEVRTQDIAVTPGASNCLDSLLFSICEVGDSILVVAPYWSGFDFHFVLRPGIKIIPVYTESCDRLNEPNRLLSDSLVPALEEALRTCEDAGRVKALVLSNPHNPFARCYPEHVLAEAIHWCADHKLHYVSDEVYALSDFSRENDTPDGNGDMPPNDEKSRDEVNDTVIEANPATPFISALALHLDAEKTPPISIIWSTSKDLGSSGFRMGVHVSRMRTPALQDNGHTDENHIPESSPSLLTISLALLSTTQLPTISMLLTHALLTSASFDTLVTQNRQRLRRHHGVVTRRLQGWGVPFVPATSGPYLLAQLGAIMEGSQQQDRKDSPVADETAQNGLSERGRVSDFQGRDVAEVLRSEAGVLVAPGQSFHMRGQGLELGWVRITFAVPMEVLEDGLNRIESTLELGKSKKPRGEVV